MDEQLINEYINNLANQVNTLTQENILLKTMFELPGQDNIEEVIVHTSAAKGTTHPLIVHSKNKSKSDKTSAA